MPRFLPALACLLAFAAASAGCEGDEPERSAAPPPDAAAALAGAPAPLAALHEQANELLDGGAEAFERRLRELRGYPVVVNKWGSWCDPCIRELPMFQRQALERGKRIAFLGVDAVEYDGGAAARELLEEIPLSYPSYADPDLKVSAVFSGSVATPATAFYDSKGELAYLKQGEYADEEDLVADIERYAR